MQGTGQGDVVDVVTGRVRQRPILPPARHASVDQLRVPRHAVIRAQAQALGHAGPEAFEQRIRRLRQPQHRLHALGLFQIHTDGAPVAGKNIPRGTCPRPHAIHADHLRAHIRKHHPAEGPRTDTGQFDDAISMKWSHALPPLFPNE